MAHDHPPEQPGEHTPEQEREQHEQDTVRRLAAAINRAGLQTPVAMTLDILKPLDFISSQVVVFLAPFVRGHRWEQYTAALTNEEGWHTLRHHLHHPDERGSP
jgi:hypothetical protein